MLLGGMHPMRRTSARTGKSSYSWALTILNSSTLKIVFKIPAIQLLTVLSEQWTAILTPWLTPSACLKIGLDFYHWCIPSPVGGSESKSPLAHEYHGISELVRLFVIPENILGEFMSSVYRNHRKAINKLSCPIILVHKQMNPPIHMTCTKYLGDIFSLYRKKVEGKIKKVSLLVAYLFSNCQTKLVKLEILEQPLCY